jgi:hypothetical protein
MANNVIKDAVTFLSMDERLQNGNWPRWRDTIVTLMELRGLDGHLTGATALPIEIPNDPANAAERLTWTSNDAIARANIKLNIEDKETYSLPPTATAHDWWTTLTARFQSTDRVTQAALERQLHAKKYEEGTSMRDHLDELKRRRTAANIAGSEIREPRFCTIILQSLPVTWNHVAIPLYQHLNADDVIHQLLAAEGHFEAQRQPLDIGTKTQAFSADVKDPRDLMVCSNCNKKRHLKENCYAAGGGKEGQWPATWHKHVRKAHIATAETPASSPTTTALLAETLDEYATNFSFMAALNEHSLSLATYLDSGASNHYFVDRSWFSEYVEITPITGSAAKAGSTFSIIGMGTVCIQTPINGKTNIVTLRNVMHAPDLTANLISIAKSARNGCTGTYDGDLLRVFDPRKQLILLGVLHNNDMYRVTVEPQLDGRKPSAFLSVDPRAHATSSSRAPLDLWHRRLAHLNEQSVRLNTEAVIGMEIMGHMPEGVCVPCLKGKQQRGRFHESQPESNVLQRVYIDLIGPISPPTINGESYALTADDGGSSYHHVALLKSKTADETLRWLKYFHALAERQTGKKLISIRTDNGLEFCNAQWAEYTTLHGILHEKTTPYTPQQNGVSERGHRTLANAARSMMFDALAPRTLWGQAFLAAGYLLNLSPSRRQNGKTPHELWYGRKPNVAHLRVWGCKAYAKVPEPLRTKLDDKSIEGILVGYTSDANYVIYVPSGPGRLIRSRDVVFDEGVSMRSRTHEQEVSVNLPTQPVPNPHMPPQNPPGNGQPPPSPPPPNEPPPLRRSTRDRTQTRAMTQSKDYEKFEQAARTRGEAWADNKHVALLVADSVPKTYQEAMNDEDTWLEPMTNEYLDLIAMDVWELIPRPKGANVIGSKWCFANKYNNSGEVEKRKARLVAKGFHQIPGIDFFESHHSVVRFDSLRALCAIAAIEDMEIGQIDIDKAYLNAELTETVLMEQPEGFIAQGKEGHVCKLKRALYGTMQAGNEWWTAFDKTYADMGFVRSRADECVRTRGEKEKRNRVITGTYTDDVTILSDTKEGLVEVKEELRKSYGIKDGGPLNWMLGIKFERNREKKLIRLSQRAYSERILERFNMTGCNPAKTPLPPGLKLSRDNRPTTQAEREEMKNVPYREAVGSVMYLATGTRPDLAFAMQHLSKAMSDPGLAHWNAMKHVFRYISGTLDYGITYDGNDPDGLNPQSYTDSSFGDCPDTGRSTQGYVVTMAGGPVSWSSKRQDCVTLSTGEAEYVALVHVAKTQVWLSNFLSELKIQIPIPLTIRGDNKAALSLATKTVNYSRARHIKLSYFWLRDYVKEKILNVVHIPGFSNPADIMTKAITTDTNGRHARRLGLAD